MSSVWTSKQDKRHLKGFYYEFLRAPQFVNSLVVTAASTRSFSEEAWQGKDVAHLKDTATNLQLLGQVVNVLGDQEVV